MTLGKTDSQGNPRLRPGLSTDGVISERISGTQKIQRVFKLREAQENARIVAGFFVKIQK